LDSDNLYWIDHASGQIYSFPLHGSSAFDGGSAYLGTSPTVSWEIVVHDGVLYWGTESGTMDAMSTMGGPISIVEDIPGSSPGGLSIGGDSLYSVDRTSGDIVSLNLNDGGFTVLVQGSFAGMQVGGGYINYGDGSVFCIRPADPVRLGA
jgi:hypothetical protein